jgi:hypothetical protein
MLYCIEELRQTMWHIVERWVMCINNERVLCEEMEEKEDDFFIKMRR